MSTVLDEASWLTTTSAEDLQTCALAHGLTELRLRLFLVACGNLIWDNMPYNCHVYFEALAREVEGQATATDRRRLGACGPLPNWLGWCHRQGRQRAALRTATAALAREVFGNPFRPGPFSPEWRTSTAVALARQMYDASEFSAMPILADALQDAGCDSDDMLDHCRDPSAAHVRGCWVVEFVLGSA